MRSSGIAAIAYNRLKEKLGMPQSSTRMYDFIQQLAYPDREVRERFHVDAIDVGQAFLTGDDDWREWTLNDGSQCLIPYYLNVEKDEEGSVLLKHSDGTVLGKKPASSLYVDQTYWVYGSYESIPEYIDDEDLQRHMWAVPTPPGHLDITNAEDRDPFVRTIKDLRETTDDALMLSVGNNLFESGTFIRNMENFLVDLYLDKKGAARLLDALMTLHMDKLEKVLDAVGPYVDVLMFGDDFGSQLGPLMSPEVYRELFKPRQKEMWDYVHRNSNCKVFLHSCGSIYELIPDMIDAGLDVLNPVQTSAHNMDPALLKREFGQDLAFWGGGCDTRDVLPHATPGEITDHVRRRIDILAKDGGFVFNQVHNILADVPPENIIAMFDTAYGYGLS
jgi:uroporphyrinogen decarboxylase